MWLTEQQEAVQLAKTAAPGDKQRPANTTFAGKNELVVVGRRERGESKRRSAIGGGARAASDSSGRSKIPSSTYSRPSAPWRACRPKSSQSNPCSSDVCVSPCGATGARWAAIRVLPVLANSKPSSGALLI